MQEVSQNKEVPDVSVGREREAPHGVWYDVPCEGDRDRDTLHHQLCVDVLQDVVHSVADHPPHLICIVVVVMVNSDYLYTDSKVLEYRIGCQERRLTQGRERRIF